MLVARGPSPSVEGDSPVWAVSSSSGKFWSLDELVRSNRFASLIGIAKLRFSPPLRCKVVIPITSPAVLNNGPPLLPGEMGAVICNYVIVSDDETILAHSESGTLGDWLTDFIRHND